MDCCFFSGILYFVFVSHSKACVLQYTMCTLAYYYICKSDCFTDFQIPWKIVWFLDSSWFIKGIICLLLYIALQTWLCLYRTPKQPGLASEISGQTKLLRWCSFDQFIFDKLYWGNKIEYYTYVYSSNFSNMVFCCDCGSLDGICYSPSLHPAPPLSHWAN